VGPYLGLFTVVWIYMRHYLNLRILVSLFFEFKTVGPYELNWETEQYKCDLSHYITAALLGSLQCLNLFWLFSILRIAYRFLFFNALSDERSDAEDDEEFEREMGDEKARIEREQEELRRMRELSVPSIRVNGSAQEARASGVSPARKAGRRKA
jgi:very-long-chain ceramide synthase